MKADFETIGKRMPYAEPKGYVEDLVGRCADRAIAKRSQATARPFLRRVGIAVTSMAAALLAAAIIFPAISGPAGGMVTAEAIAQSSSLGDVLSTMSNDELAAIDYYSFDDIPTEYDETNE